MLMQIERLLTSTKTIRNPQFIGCEWLRYSTHKPNEMNTLTLNISNLPQTKCLESEMCVEIICCAYLFSKDKRKENEKNFNWLYNVSNRNLILSVTRDVCKFHSVSMTWSFVFLVFLSFFRWTLKFRTVFRLSLACFQSAIVVVVVDLQKIESNAFI